MVKLPVLGKDSGPDGVSSEEVPEAASRESGSQQPHDNEDRAVCVYEAGVQPPSNGREASLVPDSRR